MPVLIGLVALTPSKAQFIDRIGLSGGFVSAHATDNMDQFDLERRSGWTASAFIEKRVLPALSVRSEVGYIQRGFVDTQEEIDADGTLLSVVESETQFDYLTIPVLAKLVYDTSPAAVYALAGPRLDILLNRDAEDFEFSDGTLVESEIADFYDSTALGGTVGIGVETHLSSLHLFIESHYDVDFTDSFPSDVPRTVRNNAIVVVMGIAF
jgi:hypothetical protein